MVAASEGSCSSIGPDALPKLAAAPGTPQAGEAELVALRITLRNDGVHQLLLDPANVRWEPAQSPAAGLPPLSPLPAPVVPMYLARPAAAFTALGPMSPGIGMLPGLFAALANAAELENQKKALEAWKAIVQGDMLMAGVAVAGAERSGIVYFPKLKVGYGTLAVPVIELDDAVRYTVRLDLSGARP